MFHTEPAEKDKSLFYIKNQNLKAFLTRSHKDTKKSKIFYFPWAQCVYILFCLIQHDLFKGQASRQDGTPTANTIFSFLIPLS